MDFFTESETTGFNINPKPNSVNRTPPLFSSKYDILLPKKADHGVMQPAVAYSGK